MTTVDQFYREVAAMRNAQRRYFLTNSPKWLAKAKEHEAKVDAAMEAFVSMKRTYLPFD